MSTPEEVSLRSFAFERILKQDTSTKSINLLGRVGGELAIIIAEKVAFDVDTECLRYFSQPSRLSDVHLLDRNDIYHWFLATQTPGLLPSHADAKVTLICPATETHVRKYSQQNLRMVVETPGMYQELVKPYIEQKRSSGRLNWVYNILEHKVESDRIILENVDKEKGFILLPDLKWDRKTLNSLYTVAIVHRRDIHSLRDLKKEHVLWLKQMHTEITAGICAKYPELEEDQLKLYIHYQPSYYHFHIHAVSIHHDGGLGQASGKAVLVRNVISQLETMADDANIGFAGVELAYLLGEESELWQTVFVK